MFVCGNEWRDESREDKWKGYHGYQKNCSGDYCHYLVYTPQAVGYIFVSLLTPEILLDVIYPAKIKSQIEFTSLKQTYRDILE